MSNKSLSTLQICNKLNSIVDAEDFYKDNTYNLIYELSLRQINRMGTPLNMYQRKNVCCDVACNTVLYLHRVYKTGFKVTNWIRFIYNKTLKTLMAQYDSLGNIRPEIIELNDPSQEIKLLKYLYRKPEYTINDVETKMVLENIGQSVLFYVKSLCRYSKKYKYYHDIITSTLLSLLFNKPIYINTLKQFDKVYVDTLILIVRGRLLQDIKHDIYHDIYRMVGEIWQV